MRSEFEEYAAWKTWLPESFGKFNRLDAQYFAAETGIRHDMSVRVLELGFGNGAFLGWARSCGAEVWGVEANPMLVDRAARMIGVDRVFGDIFDTKLDVLSGTLDHVVAFDVIEHVPQDVLPRLLGRMRELLDPAGRITLRFPNGDSPFGRAVQHGDPTHVTTLGRGKIVCLARQAGLRPHGVRAPALPLAGVGFARGLRRAAVLLGRVLLEHIVGSLYFGGSVIPLDPNYTAIFVRTNVADSKAS